MSSYTKIQYCPKYAIPEIVVMDAIPLEKQFAGISVFKYLETKNIPNDLKVRENRNGVVSYETLVNILLSENTFQIVGRPNPNFTCHRCGKTDLSQEFIILENIKQGTYQVPLEDKNGNRLCEPCFKLRNT